MTQNEQPTSSPAGAMDRRDMLRRSLAGGVAVTTVASGIVTGHAMPASAQSVVFNCQGDEFYNFGSTTGSNRRVEIVVPADCPISYVIWGSGGDAGTRLELDSGPVVGRGDGGHGGFGARWAGWIDAVPTQRTLILDVGSGIVPDGVTSNAQPGGFSLSGAGGRSGAGAARRTNSGTIGSGSTASSYVYSGQGGGGGGGGGASAIRVKGEAVGSETLLIVAGGGAGGGGGHAYVRRSVGATVISDGGGGNGRWAGDARNVDGPPAPGTVRAGETGNSSVNASAGSGASTTGGGFGGNGGGGFDGTNGHTWNGSGNAGRGGNGNYGNLIYEASGGGGGGGGGYHGGGGGEGGDPDQNAANRGGAGGGAGASIERGSASTAHIPASLLAQQPPFYAYKFSEIGRRAQNTWAGPNQLGVAGTILIKVGVTEIISDSTGAVLV